MPSVEQNRDVKATKLATILHANGFTLAQAQGFNPGQWVLAGQVAGVRPPSTSVPLALEKLRALEDQDRALAVARVFFLDSPEVAEPPQIVCVNCDLGRLQTIFPGESDVPCCDGNRYCPTCGEEHTDARRDNEECRACSGAEE